MSALAVSALAASALGIAACGPSEPIDGGDPALHRQKPSAEGPASGVSIVSLGPETSPAGLEELKTAFVAGNPGYDLEYRNELTRLDVAERARIVFVQSVEAGSEIDPELRPSLETGSEETGLPDPGPMTVVTILADAGETDVPRRSAVSVGDLIVLRSGHGLATGAPIGALIFEVPDAPDASVPHFIRPDWDPGITDVVGGCATEEGAYRRILLTWLRDNGPYTFHGLNAHRVRIEDSFTHYHPADIGFDELYLVQMARPGATLLTSSMVEAVEARNEITTEQAGDLFEEHELAVGDLIYIPRGTIHRGVGGALVQVITVPGFRPGAEIGVDHHLQAINRRLGLTGDRAIPLHAAAADQAVIR